MVIWLFQEEQMTASEARQKLRDRNLRYVAKELEVSYDKLTRWNKGNESALSLEELRRLVEYLRK
jgi:5-bromo-4-chloroindolyl phosphate hydrolysis protein